MQPCKLKGLRKNSLRVISKGGGCPGICFFLGLVKKSGSSVAVATSG